MNKRFQSLNFSIRTEKHVHTHGHGSDHTSSVFSSYFLVISNTLESGGGPPPVVATWTAPPVAVVAGTILSTETVGNATNAGPNFCPTCGAACAGLNFCGSCGSKL